MGKVMGDYKSPGFIGQTFFTADFKSAGTPDGRQDFKSVGTPDGRQDFKSVGTPSGRLEYPVRRFDGFAIRRLKMSQPLYALGICNPQQSVLAHLLLGDYKSPGFIGRTFFYGGFQIRRDA